MANSVWAQLKDAEQPMAPPPDTSPSVWAGIDNSAPAKMATPQAAVTLAPTPEEKQIQNDQHQLAKIRWQQQNPWGTQENHPGKLGKVAHVFSTLGNIAGDIFAPSVMANIPGTQMNRDMQEHGLAHRLNSEITDESQNQEREANASHLNAETPQIAPNAESTRKLQGAETDEKEAAVNNPSLAVGYAHAVNQAIKEGRDPATDPIVQHLQDAITGLQKQAAPKGGEHVSLMDPKTGKPFAGTYDPTEKKYYDAAGKEVLNAVPYERPITVNAGDASLDREAMRLAKPYEKGVADANAQLEKIADARTMINGSAEAQALGIPKVLTALVSGQGSGVRITLPELNAIAKARGLSGDVEGTLRSWSGQGKLTPEQQRQLTGILDDVQRRILEKQSIHNEALDSINGAPSREAVIEADKMARQKLAAIEKSGTAGQEPQRPANVPDGYVFKDGPRGKGWYRP
jgi:hypothetical protein